VLFETHEETTESSSVVELRRKQKKLTGSEFGQAIAVQADVSDPKAIQRLLDAAESAFGGIDVLGALSEAVRRVWILADCSQLHWAK